MKKSCCYRYAAVAVLAALVISTTNADVPAKSVPAKDPPKQIAIVADISGSMNEKQKLHALKESIKLLIAFLGEEWEVVLVTFSHESRRAVFTLKTAADRQLANAYIAGLRAEGGTAYLPALEAVKLPDGVPWIFASDGLPDEKAETIFATLKTLGVKNLHTVAIGAETDAKKLLAEMASRCNGSSFAVEDSAALVKSFLAIAQHLGAYRTYEPSEERVNLKVQGKLIALGYDSTPRISVANKVLQPQLEFLARLPGEHVGVKIVDFANRSEATIEATDKRTKQGRLAAIFRNDLARSELLLDAPNGIAPANTNVRVAVRFTTPDGKPLDPRQEKSLTAEFRVLDGDRKELVKVKGKPRADQPILEADVPLPGSGPVTIVVDTTDSSSG